MKNTNKILKITLLIMLLLTLSACGGNSEEGPPPTEIDPIAIITSAAGTAFAQLTQTAMAFSPTPEPATATPTQIPATATLFNPNATTLPASAIQTTGTPPTLQPGAPTPIPSVTQIQLGATQDGPLCDDMAFISDVTFPDGSNIEFLGGKVEKIWLVQNTGICTWGEGYTLIPIGGDTSALRAQNPAWVLNLGAVAPGEFRNLEVDLHAPDVAGEYAVAFRMKNAKGYYFGQVIDVRVVVEIR